MNLLIAPRHSLYSAYTHRNFRGFITPNNAQIPIGRKGSSLLFLIVLTGFKKVGARLVQHGLKVMCPEIARKPDPLTFPLYF